jgi:hypothetical protein
VREGVFGAKSLRPERCKRIRASFSQKRAMLLMVFAARGFPSVYRHVVLENQNRWIMLFHYSAGLGLTMH